MRRNMPLPRFRPKTALAEIFQPVRRRKAIRFQPVRRRKAIRFQPVRCLRNFLRAMKESSSAEKARNSQESAR